MGSRMRNKKKTSEAEIWLQSMWYTKEQDRGVPDRCFCKWCMPKCPSLEDSLRTGWHEILAQICSLHKGVGQKQGLLGTLQIMSYSLASLALPGVLTVFLHVSVELFVSDYTCCVSYRIQFYKKWQEFWQQLGLEVVCLAHSKWSFLL